MVSAPPLPPSTTVNRSTAPLPTPNCSTAAKKLWLGGGVPVANVYDFVLVKLRPSELPVESACTAWTLIVPLTPVALGVRV